MNVTVTDGPFGRSIRITDATTEQVVEVWAALHPVAPAQDVQVPEEGRAYVGQVIRKGSKFADMPKGVRILDAGTGDGLRYRHTSRDGSKFCWSMVAHARPDEEDFSRTTSTARLWTDMTVRGTW